MNLCVYMVSKGTYINVLMLAVPHVILDYKVSHTNSNIQIKVLYRLEFVDIFKI